MLALLLILIFFRPFISSLAFLDLNTIYYAILLIALAVWFGYKGVGVDNIRTLKYPLFFFFFALVMSLVFSINRFNSLKEIYRYATGLFLFIFAASLTCKDRNRLLSTLIFAAAIASLFAIYQYLFGFQHLMNYLNSEGITDMPCLHYVTSKRVFLPFVTPNALAGYLAMVLPLTFVHKKRIWFILPILIALLLTKSLGVFISILLAIMIYLILGGRLKRRLIILLCVFILIIGTIFVVRSSSPAHLKPTFSAMMRLNYWQGALRVIQTRPLTGLGIGNFNLIRSRYAHNSYLQIWVELGMLGLISILWFIGATFRGSLKNITPADRNTVMVLILSNTVFLIHNFIDFTFFLPEVSFIWWVILGMLFSCRLQTQK